MIKVYANSQDYLNKISIALVNIDYNGKRTYARAMQPFYIEEDLGSQIAPTLSIDRDIAQGIMDSLYSIGFRPSEAPTLQNELIAVKEHLNDMRKIVFKKEGIK